MVLVVVEVLVLLVFKELLLMVAVVELAQHLPLRVQECFTLAVVVVEHYQLLL
jgi:hypothetical protein